jgi:RimJ/RimL family protein N-acetyltransferase
MRRDLSSNRIRFRSIEQEQLEEIHERQNTDCTYDISMELDLDPSWAPATLDQTKAKLEEFQKKDRTSILAIYSKDDEFIGIAAYSASWDPWNPHIGVTVWPEHRRKGLGTEAAKLLLQAAFDDSVAHVVSTGVSGFSEEGIAFAESLGFKKQGGMRRAAVIGGEFIDHIFFDMLRDEYQELYPKGGED